MKIFFAREIYEENLTEKRWRREKSLCPFLSMLRRACWAMLWTGYRHFVQRLLLLVALQSREPKIVLKKIA
jgi:hypothetical protein